MTFIRRSFLPSVFLACVWIGCSKREDSKSSAQVIARGAGFPCPLTLSLRVDAVCSQDCFTEHVLTNGSLRKKVECGSH